MGGLFGGQNQTIYNESPKINQLRLQTSGYGACLPIVFGTNRVAGNLIDYIDFTAIEHRDEQTQRTGKGGGSSTTNVNVTYTYTVAAAIALCEGPIIGFGRMWATKDKFCVGKTAVRDPAFQSLLTALVSGLPEYQGANWHYGTTPQSPWAYMLGAHPERALNYAGLAYVADSYFDLGSSGSMPNYSFEVMGQRLLAGKLDADPADIVQYLLTDSRYGVGWSSSWIDSLTLSDFSLYCQAAGILFSPVLDEQREAQEILTEILDAANVGVVDSCGKLKFIPWAEESVASGGLTWDPNLTAVADLTDDDFIVDSEEEPITRTRDLTADAFNSYKVEYASRDLEYNTDVETFSDQSAIELYGHRPADVIDATKLICLKDVAAKVAQQKCKRAVYLRNQYTFKLAPQHILLEPMDIVTITDARMGISKRPVRILEIEDDDDDVRHVRAADCQIGIGGADVYTGEAGTNLGVDYNALPGDANAPIIFTAPLTLTDGRLEIWLAASGPLANWGGCSIWISQDGTNYRKAGTVFGKATTGILTQDLLAPEANPDTENVLSVDLTSSLGSLSSVPQAEVDSGVSLCYVNGEFLAYRDAALTGGYTYDLEYLRRGLYGSAAEQHSDGGIFVYCDRALFKYSLPGETVGQTVYVKLTSFNTVGRREQDLADVTEYTYVVGSAPKENIETVTLVKNGADVTIAWIRPVSVIYDRSEVYRRDRDLTFNDLAGKTFNDLAGETFNSISNGALSYQLWNFVGYATDRITDRNLAAGLYRYKVQAAYVGGQKLDFADAPVASITV